jgi:hypothetical protein
VSRGAWQKGNHAGLDGSLVAVITTIQASQRRISLSKGNNKEPKSDKSKPKTDTSPYKAAQGTGKPAISLLARKTGR